MKQCNLLVKNVFMVTLDENRRLIKDGVLVVDAERIAAVGGPELEKEYNADLVIDGRGKFAFPGLVSTHTHSFQVMTRGFGRDKTLFDWLDSSVRRALHAYCDEYCYYAALVSAMESLRSGTTTTMDYMYCQSKKGGFSDPVIQAFQDAGIRTVYGRGRADTSGLPKEFACGHVDAEQDYFDDVIRLQKKFKGNDMMRIAMAPGLINDLSEEGFIETRRLADEYHLLITVHTLETTDDNDFCMKKNGLPLMPYLEKLGVLGPDFVAVHCVDMHDWDFEIFKRLGVKVSHCPMSNMILASGIAPVKEMADAGICVSLGVDGASSNDTQNMLDCVRMASMLQKARTRDPMAIPATQALEMGTLGGAEALGMAKLIGSLEVGKKADFFLFDPAVLQTAPTHDPICSLVYNGLPANIDTVVVNGKVQIENKIFTNLDEEKIIAKTQELARKLAHETGMTVTQWGQTIDL